MKRKLHVRRGDTVEIITGNARGTIGRIIRALPARGKVVIEGQNMVWKHFKRSRQHPRGERVEVERPIDASNVLLVCANKDCVSFNRGVRTRATTRPDGTKTRACAKCGHEIAGAQ